MGLLESMIEEVALADVVPEGEAILKGGVKGRTVVRVAE